MENNLIGGQIMKFRKAAGLTQEELGRSVGVSTQAVSRWECGGAPDVTLLPAIADRLGVTIDALFGREGSETVDIFHLVRKWTHTIPKEQALDQINRLIWAAVSQVPFGFRNVDTLPYLESCKNMSEQRGEQSVSCSKLETDDGVLFGVFANDFSYSTLCPRPEEGYAAYFPEKETTREVCGLLSQPGCLEVIEFMMRQLGQYYAPDVIADGTGMETDAAKALLEKMTRTHLLYDIEIGMRDGMENVYALQDAGAFIPLLYLINGISQEKHFYYLNYGYRQKPLL